MKVKTGDIVKHSYDKIGTDLTYLVFKQRDNLLYDGDKERYFWLIPLNDNKPFPSGVPAKHLVGCISSGENCLYKKSIREAKDRPRIWGEK